MGSGRLHAKGVTELAAPTGYRYLRHLGAGGFGDVHLAEHIATGRAVAIKYIQPHLLTDPDVLARFRREAQILAATDVPSVVRVYDLDTTGDPAHLIMEYVPGVTLWDLMEQAPLPAHQALVVLRDVADALKVMAGRGLVHRDIKPSNVFVLPTGRAKLGDFGLARAVADDAGFRTVGAPAGTPAYFPPEVSSGAAEATVESDAYSFAVMVYEVLTGSQPISAPDAISLITAHWTQAPRPVTDAMPGFPASVAPVLMRALAKMPEGRPLPHALMAALDAVPREAWPTNERPVVRVPEAPALPREYDDATGSLQERRPAPLTAPVTSARDGGSAVSAPPPAKRRFRGRQIAAVVMLAAVVLSGLAATVLLREDSSEQPTQPTDLAVSEISVSADPARVRCPSATLDLEATIVTNGSAGNVTVRWTLPDGTPGPEQSFAVSDGQQEVVATVETTLTGTRALEGEAVVEADPSGLRASTPVTYACPDRPQRNR